MAKFPLFWRILLRIRDKGDKILIESRSRIAALVFRLYVLVRGILRGEITVSIRFGR